MPILAIDALVVGIRLIDGKTLVYASSSPFSNLFDSKPSCLRDVKQSEQYISFPGIGTNGTIAGPPQEVQSALWVSVRDLSCCDVLNVAACMNARAPSVLICGT